MARSSIRQKQISGIPLPKDISAMVTIMMGITVFILIYFYWMSLFFYVVGSNFSKPYATFVAIIGFFLYIAHCVDYVPVNKEKAQLFFGKYTGVSFSSGLCLIPRLPFPFLMLVLRVIFDERIYKYFGWTLEGEVEVQSIVVPFNSEGMTLDNIRIRMKGELIFEVEDVAVFLSQTKGNTDRTSLIKSVSSLCSSRIKRKVIAVHSLRDLYNGEYMEGSEEANEWINSICSMITEYGLKLSESPMLEIEILSKQIEKLFDRNQSDELIARNAVIAGKTFKQFRSLVSDLSDEEAFLLYSQAMANQEGISFGINSFKFGRGDRGSTN